MRGLNALRELPRCLWLLVGADLINTTGYFVLPFLTILMTDRLGASSEEAGIYLALASLAHAPGAALGGKLADHLGRRWTYIGARVFAALTLMSCAFAGRTKLVPILIVGSVMASSATEPAVTAMVADVTTPAQRQAAYSLVYFGRNLGFAIGPALAGVLYRTHPTWLFLGDGITSLIAGVVVFGWIRETLPSKSQQRAETPVAECAEEGSLVSALLRRPWVLVCSFALSAYALVFAQCFFGVPLQARELFGDQGPSRYGLLMSINALSVVVFTAPIVRLTSKLATTRRLVLGGLAYAAGFGSLFALRSFPALAASTMVWSIGEVLAQTNSRVFVADNSPNSHRGRFSAAVQLLSGGGYVIGPWIGGMIVARAGLESLWKLCLVVALGAAFVLLLPRWLGRGRLVDGAAGGSIGSPAG